MVPEARESEVLDQLSSLDLSQTATVASLTQGTGTPSKLRKATISQYRPNEIVVEFDAGPAGMLVLSDPWYPGWEYYEYFRDSSQPCSRVDYAFRGAPVLAGSTSVRLRFNPQSFNSGIYYSIAALAMLPLILLGPPTLKALR